MSTEIHEPRCPSCDKIGNELITYTESSNQSKGGDPWFNTVHCSECGHVYGVFAKVVHSPTPPKMF